MPASFFNVVVIFVTKCVYLSLHRGLDYDILVDVSATSH